MQEAPSKKIKKSVCCSIDKNLRAGIDCPLFEKPGLKPKIMALIRYFFPLSLVFLFLSAFSETAFSTSERGAKKPTNADVKRLEETDFGQALIRGASIEEFREEYKKLTELPSQTALAILTAKDSKKNSALHYMVQVKEEDREAFAGEILHYSLDLMNGMDHYDIFDDWNTENLTPKDLAKQVGNSTAAEYLHLVENMAKTHRGNRRMSGADETKITVTSSFWQKERNKKGILGILVFINGSLFTINGMIFNSPEMYLVGLPHLILGGTACYEVFKEFRSGKKPTAPL